MGLPKTYLSIDIETTGLEHESCQVIEFAAVLDDLDGNFAFAPTFHCLIDHGDYVNGEIAGVLMNVELLKEIQAARNAIAAGKPLEGVNIMGPHDLYDSFRQWLKTLGAFTQPLTIAGKNYSTFDKLFLAKLHFDELPMRHRIIDPACMYWKPEVDGTVLPNTKLCLERAGLPTDVKHRAVDDAKDVCRLIRKKFGLPI